MVVILIIQEAAQYIHRVLSYMKADSQLYNQLHVFQ